MSLRSLVEVRFRVVVLILIILEDTLRVFLVLFIVLAPFVLIHIIMEDTLRKYLKNPIKSLKYES